MQNAEVYLNLLSERGRQGLPVERVYRQLFNRNLYLVAYGMSRPMQLRVDRKLVTLIKNALRIRRQERRLANAS